MQIFIDTEKYNSYYIFSSSKIYKLNMACKFCKLTYGLENPRKNELFATGHFLAFFDDNPPPNKHISANKYILIIFKKHKDSLKRCEWKDLLEKVLDRSEEFLKQRFNATEYTIEAMKSSNGHYHFYIITECLCSDCNLQLSKPA